MRLVSFHVRLFRNVIDSGEIQVTDAIEMQASKGHCYGIRFTGIRYDTGNPLGLLTTSIAYALKRPDIAPALREFMRQALKEE